MKKYILILFVFTSLITFGQNPKVPSSMYFGDIQLKINSSAQKKIQSHVDSYRRSPIFFQKKVALANLYFPIIEAKFREENVPEDFKYLIIQESGFVSDAVSSSNAVGFWQFKKATGLEVGLTINSKVDERKNISSSSTGAANYFKSNNQYFGNWIYALQAYNQGAGGTQKDSNPKYYGKKKMDITGKTHWYVLKFLAHKIAYQGEVGGESGLGFYLKEFKTNNKSLKEIAKKEKLDLTQLKTYNKWLSSSKIPNDKEYLVLLTISGEGTSSTIPKKEEGNESSEQISGNIKIDLKKKTVKIKAGDNIPEVTIKLGKNGDLQVEYLKENPHIFTQLNGLNVIKAEKGDTKDVLALAGGISTSRFLKYNDIHSFDPIKPGQFYYLKSKRSRPFAAYHTVKWNETAWSIAQKYGMRRKFLLKRNRIKEYHELKAGRVLWLRKTRPKNKPVTFEDPGPIPQPKKKFVPKKITLPKRDEKLKKEVDKIIEGGISHNDEEISDKTITQEVTLDMEKNKIPIKNNLITENQEVIAPQTQKDIEERDDVIFHTVQQGETLYGISKKYKIPVETIVKWNRLKEQTVSVNQMLIVALKENKTETPNPIANETRNIIHTVSIGETMYSISKKYNISVKNILKWNNKKDNSLSEGEKIIIGIKK